MPDLSIPEADLDQLVVMEAESLGLEGYRDAHATDALEAEWGAYEDELRRVLLEYVERAIPGEDAESFVEDLFAEGGASLNVWLTLAGHGAGIWDGRWDEWFDDDEADLLKEHLKAEMLSGWHDRLERALVEAAEETAGDEDDGEEGDEDEDAENPSEDDDEEEEDEDGEGFCVHGVSLAEGDCSRCGDGRLG